MSDLSNLVVSSGGHEGVIKAMDNLYPEMSREDCRRVSRVMASYLKRFGKEGLWERVNGKSIKEILSSFDGHVLRVEAEGKVGTTSYILFGGEISDK